MRAAPHMSVLALSVFASAATVTSATAAPFFFSTGDPDGKIATASRPGSGSSFEIESADDFVLPSATSLNSATFTGLLPSGSTVRNVVVETYRVFPQDSNIGRTSGPPTFSTSQVPTRVNSPSDVAFTSNESSGGSLSFTTNVLSASFTASNSVTPGGIHPSPNFFTGGNGPATGEEVRFDVTFNSPLVLPGDHYFFVPQVELDTGNFLWLSAPRPIVAPGTPFPTGTADLQSWTRDNFLDPDWLRIGTDITRQGPFNSAFSVTGVEVPEPGALALLFGMIPGLVWAVRRRG
jgi:hypothetical protein